MAETLFTIVKDARLHEEIGRQLARRIVRGDFPAGSYLPAESELIARLGVSRMVIREALRSLEECGLIAVRHGRRTIVAPQEEWDVINRLVLITYRDEGLIAPLLRDSLRVRRILEPAIAAEAAEKATPELLAALAACLERQAAALDAPDTFLEEDITFHNLLVSATHNRILARMLAAIRDLLHVSREVTNQLPNALPGALRSHQRIHDEVRAGDPDRAHRAMLDHLDRTGPAYLSLGREEAQAPEEDTYAGREVHPRTLAVLAPTPRGPPPPPGQGGLPIGVSWPRLCASLPTVPGPARQASRHIPKNQHSSATPPVGERQRAGRDPPCGPTKREGSP